MNKLLSALVILSLFFSSCATIFSGTKQSVSFNSTPANATVFTVTKKGKETVIGTTPCAVIIPKKTKNIKFEKEGYYNEVYNIRAESGVNAWYWINLSSVLLFGYGIIPGAIDLITGAYIKMPEKVSVELKKK